LSYVMASFSAKVNRDGTSSGLAFKRFSVSLVQPTGVIDR
jgi:hypothetical protein